jgi:hypothetical protein
MEDESKILKELAKVRAQLEHEIMLEHWEECNEVIGMLSALGLRGIVSKVRISPERQGEENLPAVAIPNTEFDALKRLLMKLI